ncbi:MAG TPA: TM2 domain-containing protein [Microthrixaceae bacterium]|nr:TM2 domain-containing protein [Microthrixaceae bacterium]
MDDPDIQNDQPAPDQNGSDSTVPHPIQAEPTEPDLDSPAAGSSPVAQPGWYADAQGVTRWWDGVNWGQTATDSNSQSGPPPFTPPPFQAMGPSPSAGSPVGPDGRPIDPNTLPPYDPGKKVACGVLAILLGGLGIHKFILGYTSEGIIMLLLLLCGISPIIGIVEGIIYLTKSDSEFYWTYVAGRKPWF